MLGKVLLYAGFPTVPSCSLLSVPIAVEECLVCPERSAVRAFVSVVRTSVCVVVRILETAEHLLITILCWHL